MKREELLRQLRAHGCVLKREGGSHSLWVNPVNGNMQAIPRHKEVSDMLARSIAKRLGLSDAAEK